MVLPSTTNSDTELHVDFYVDLPNSLLDATILRSTAIGRSLNRKSSFYLDNHNHVEEI